MSHDATRHSRNAFDTLAFAHELVDAGVPRAQAEAIARNILDVIAATDTNNRADYAFKEQISQCRSELSTGLQNQQNATQR